MANNGRKMVKWVMAIFLWAVLVFAGAAVHGASGPFLTPLVNRLAPGDQLVISSNEANTFDSLAGNNEVIFLGPEGIPKPRKAQAVSPDGRTITVLIPALTRSGEVAVKAKGVEVGKVTIAVSDKPREYRVCFILALVPMLFFLAFLIWLGTCLYKDLGWKLSGALSEQIEQKFLLRDSKHHVVYHEKTKDPIYEIKPIIVNSSSRLIAFVGLFVISTEILGVLISATYRYTCSGEIPDLNNFSTFILVQAPLFAPYVVNKMTKKQEKQEVEGAKTTKP